MKKKKLAKLFNSLLKTFQHCARLQNRTCLIEYYMYHYSLINRVRGEMARILATYEVDATRNQTRLHNGQQIYRSIKQT